MKVGDIHREATQLMCGKDSTRQIMIIKPKDRVANNSYYNKI